MPKKFGLRQTIADTLGIGGIMRGIRTVPHLWSICEDLMEVAPNAIMMQYVNPMAINTWAIAAKYPAIRQVGLCHSVQGTAEELAKDLDLPIDEIRYRAAGINHMAFYLNFEHRQPDGSYRDLYPDLVQGYREGPCAETRLEPALPEQGALRDADAAGLFRHRKLRAFRRIHALVHQARPPRSDREVRHSARRISRCAASSRSPAGRPRPSA